MTKKTTKPLKMTFENNGFLLSLCGSHDAHIKQIEEKLNVDIALRGNQIALFGEETSILKAKIVLEDLYQLLEKGLEITPDEVDAALRISLGLSEEETEATDVRPTDVMGIHASIKTPMKAITPRSLQQHAYVEALKRHALVFGIGPAGTGKTFIATAMAVHLLMTKKVKRLVLTRPVVEAGENLGFLPGTLEEKIDPYLRPLFDALSELLSAEKMKEYLENGTIEIAPLAYMRGRTLNGCVMVLDEAQNTTPMQMRMFLTRMGEGSRMIVTGDPSQCDLKPGQLSGLREAVSVLDGVEGLGVIKFTDVDVVRHPLVQKIVQAYDQKDRQIDMKLDDNQIW